MKILRHFGKYGALYILLVGIIARICWAAGPLGFLFISGMILFSLWATYGILRLIGMDNEEIKGTFDCFKKE